jgi:2',3'-cyclic-nucleotide 2'-phosphodiesterase/3'-nucleotidase
MTLTDPVRDILVSHIAGACMALDPVVDPTWRFTPMAGTEIVFETGPAAAAHADRSTALGLRPDGMGPEGFAQYLLRI